MSERPISPQTLEKWINLRKVLESERGRNELRKYIRKRFPDELDCIFLISVQFWEQFHGILKSKESADTKIVKVKTLAETIQSSDDFMIERPVLERLCSVDSNTLEDVLKDVLRMITEDEGLQEQYRDFYKEMNIKKKGKLKVETKRGSGEQTDASQERAGTSEEPEDSPSGTVAKLKSWCLVL